MIADFDAPFAPDPACEACGKPWPDHAGLVRLCRDNQNLLTVLKATAINTLEIHQMLVKVISVYDKHPQTPNPPHEQDSSLQDGQEL